MCGTMQGQTTTDHVGTRAPKVSDAAQTNVVSWFTTFIDTGIDSKVLLHRLY
jgi:hypothetical protein